MAVILHPDIIFAGRALAGRMSQEELSRQAGVSVSTVRRAETEEGLKGLRIGQARALLEALSRNGVGFINEPERIGVTMRIASERGS
ncbi:MAG: helix-turn-helix transcriptional regulator [Pseudomonadota bacterium]